MKGPTSRAAARVLPRVPSRSTGSRQTRASPPRRSAHQPAGVVASGSGVRAPRSSGRSKRPPIRNERPLSSSPIVTPPAAARIPPRDGPSTRPSWKLMLDRALALGRSSSGTISGTRAKKAGWKKASMLPMSAPSR